MPIPRRWAVLAFFVAVSAAVLGGVFAFGGFATRRQEEREMNTTRISVDHVRRATEKPFVSRGTRNDDVPCSMPTLGFVLA